MSKRSKTRKATSGGRFNPVVFLQTAAKGRIVSTNPKGQIIFAQGDAADSVFYIKTGKVKVTVVSKHGKEAVVAILGTDEFVPDWTAQAFGHGHCNDRMRDDASREDRDRAGSS
jgi:CRP/FNR family cyclic AMP-dependent transcriptional regulator